MANWFGNKEPAPEKSPGGSVIHRYDSDALSNVRIGFADESSMGFAEARHQAYRRICGPPANVSPDKAPRIPRIDLHTYHRRGNDGSKVCTLVTSGMSDLPMTLPAETKAPKRVELIFYCSEPCEEYIETMRWLAHFPHDQRGWIGSGHTIPNGNPPEPLFGSSVLDTILFMPTVVTRDRALADELSLGGDPVHFLWMVPLTRPECGLKLEKGFNVTLDLFGKHRHPHVFDPNCAS